MTRRLIGSGSTFELEIGYSRAVVDGEWVFVSGTTGFSYATMTIADDILEQTDQCLRNIEAALADAGRRWPTWFGPGWPTRGCGSRSKPPGGRAVG